MSKGEELEGKGESLTKNFLAFWRLRMDLRNRWSILEEEEEEEEELDSWSQRARISSAMLMFSSIMATAKDRPGEEGGLVDGVVAADECVLFFPFLEVELALAMVKKTI